MFVSPATSRRLLSAIGLVTVAMAPARVSAQTAAEHIALGDKEHVALHAPSQGETK